MRAEAAQDGFTLLEVLVALVIAALALGMLFSGGVTGLRSTQLADHYVEAVARARSHLAAIGTVVPPVPGMQTGDDGGGYHWQVSVAPAGSVLLAAPQDEAARPAQAPREGLYAVTVVISWKMDGGDRQVRLDTERIGPAPPGTAP